MAGEAASSVTIAVPLVAGVRIHRLGLPGRVRPPKQREPCIRAEPVEHGASDLLIVHALSPEGHVVGSTQLRLAIEGQVAL